jgi:hypothetical protein
MTRREWLTLAAATPLAKAAPWMQETVKPAPVSPVAIAKASTYDNNEVTSALATMFDQQGLENLVRNKTVTMKLNRTNAPHQRLNGLSPSLTHWVHPAVCGVATYLFGKAGAKRIRIVESLYNSLEPLEDFVTKGDWDVKAIQNAAKNVEFENTINLGLGKKYSRLPVGAGAICSPPGT